MYLDGEYHTKLEDEYLTEDDVSAHYQIQSSHENMYGRIYNTVTFQQSSKEDETQPIQENTIKESETHPATNKH